MDESSGTPFQRWMEQHQHKASLLAKITYAQTLYVKAYPHVTCHDPQTILNTLQNTPLRDELVSSKGILVDWVLDKFCRTPFIEVLMSHGCELWFLRNVGVNEMLRRLDIKTGPFANHVEIFDASCGSSSASAYQNKPLTNDKATVFVSYTGRYLLRNFVELLENLRGEYMWMDVFCVDQFAWTGQKNSSQVKALQNTLVENLPTQIKDIGRVALMLERWDNVNYTLHQIWVLWEIFNTAQEGVEFSILMAKEEMSRYIDCIKNGEKDKAQDTLAEIRCQDATSEDAQDQQNILKQMEGKFFEVNRRVIEQVRQWYQQKGREYIPSLSIDSEDRLRYLYNFANLLVDQGKLTDAEPLYSESLEAWRRLKGNNHLGTVSCMHNFANLLLDQGKLTRAEQLYREALETYQQLLGNDHPDTFSCMNNFATLLQAQGKLTAAEQFYRESLENRRRKLGNDHRETLKSITNLATLLKEQGKLTEADPLYRESLEGYRQLLGNDHHHTLSSINNYATFLHYQGKLKDAEPRYRESLESRRRLLGNDHPDTLDSINNFATLLKDQGKLEDAEPLFRQSLEACRKVLGNDHPDTLSSIDNLAGLLLFQRKPTDAEPLYRASLEARQRVLGNDHPDTLSSINNFASLLFFQGKLTEAEALYCKSLEAHRRLLGNDHPKTLKSINNFANLLQAQDNLTDAEA